MIQIQHPTKLTPIYSRPSANHLTSSPVRNPHFGFPHTPAVRPSPHAERTAGVLPAMEAGNTAAPAAVTAVPVGTAVLVGTVPAAVAARTAR